MEKRLIIGPVAVLVAMFLGFATDWADGAPSDTVRIHRDHATTQAPVAPSELRPERGEPLTCRAKHKDANSGQACSTRIALVTCLNTNNPNPDKNPYIKCCVHGSSIAACRTCRCP